MFYLILIVILAGLVVVIMNVNLLIYSAGKIGEVAVYLMNRYNLPPLLMFLAWIITAVFFVIFIVVNEYTLITGKVLPYVEPITVADEIREFIIKVVEYAEKEDWL